MSTTVGTKGSDVYTSTGVADPMVALSALLVRGADPSCLAKAVIDAISDKKSLEDIMVLLFQTRDIRGGKGEREVFLELFRIFLTEDSTRELALNLIDLIPEYGCWNDLFKLQARYPLATSRISEIIRLQFIKDELALASEPEPKLSLLAKWMPREGHPGAIEMAGLLTPGPMFYAMRMKYYRKRVSALNKAIKTVEIKMCSKNWADIEPSAVPGRASKKYSRAFLNLVGTKKDQVKPKNILRHPHDADRMACREHFQEYNSKTATGEIVAKGAETIFPHEIVKKAVSMGAWCESCDPYDTECSCKASLGERNQLVGVWKAMVEAAKAGGGLGRSLAMCDFSGSMANSGRNHDLPYWVSMALGLLISEVTTDEFKNTFLTFDSVPIMHMLPEGDIFDKIFSFIGRHFNIGQGLSTDFQKAMDLILQQCKDKRVKPGQEPENLIVLTDMAWDQACGSSEFSDYSGNAYRNVLKTAPWQTHVEMIRESFKRAGEDMWGEGQGLKMPTIVIWNIAATCQDFHAKADTEGVVMLSGWSPSLFKVLQTKGVVQLTPTEALRIQLDSVRYDLVRKRCNKFFMSEV